MAVTLILYTRMGPFFEGSELVVDNNYAQALLQRYGSQVRVVPRFAGTFWFQDGAVLLIYPRLSPFPLVPQPTPVPIPPFPQPGPFPPVPGGFLRVTFRSTIGRFQEGSTVLMSVQQAQQLGGLYPGVTFLDNRGNEIDEDDLFRYAGRNVFVEQRFF